MWKFILTLLDSSRRHLMHTWSGLVLAYQNVAFQSLIFKLTRVKNEGR